VGSSSIGLCVYRYRHSTSSNSHSSILSIDFEADTQLSHSHALVCQYAVHKKCVHLVEPSCVSVAPRDLRPITMVDGMLGWFGLDWFGLVWIRHGLGATTNQLSIMMRVRCTVGFLSKMGGGHKNWKKRWCVLTSEFIFYYFKSMNVCGSIAIYDVRFA
jgi:hypothetical protein